MARWLLATDQYLAKLRQKCFIRHHTVNQHITRLVKKPNGRHVKVRRPKRSRELRGVEQKTKKLKAASDAVASTRDGDDEEEETDDDEQQNEDDFENASSETGGLDPLLQTF